MEKQFEHYLINDNGSIYNTITGKRTFGGKHDGYRIFKLQNPPRQIYAHRLIAHVFLGTCPPDMEVNHKDGNKENNHIENLEYCTHKSNIQHSIDTGLANPVHHSPVKLTVEKVRAIRDMAVIGLNYKQIGEAFGVSWVTARNVVLRITWKHID